MNSPPKKRPGVATRPGFSQRENLARNGEDVNAAILDANECVVLSALMNEAGDLPVTADDFLSPPNRLIFEHLVPLPNRNLRAVTDALQLSDKLDEAGGAHRVTHISNLPHDPACLNYALEEVLSASRTRQEAEIFKQGVAGAITGEQAHQRLDEIIKPVRDCLSVRTADEILALPREPRSNFLGDRLFTLAGLLVIAGVAGVGKTRLLLQLLVALILGRPWCGIETHARGKRCLLIQNENGNGRLQDDLGSLRKSAGGDWKRVGDRLVIQTLETEADALLNFSDPGTVRRAQATIRKVEPDIVAWDPVRDYVIGDPNSDADMIASMRELARISRVGNPARAIIALHHSLTGRVGVSRAFGLERTSFGRNSKVLLSLARGMINVVPGAEDSNEQLVLTCGKNSNGREFAPIAVRLTADMIYEVAPDFDIEGWRQEVSSPGKTRRLSPQIFRELLAPGRDYEKRELVQLVKEEKGAGQSRAYDLVDQAKERGVLRFNKMTKTYAIA